MFNNLGNNFLRDLLPKFTFHNFSKFVSTNTSDIFNQLVS